MCCYPSTFAQAALGALSLGAPPDSQGHILKKLAMVDLLSIEDKSILAPHEVHERTEDVPMLNKIRKEEGLTQQQLADISGVPRRTIQNWERTGIENAAVGSVAKVARALGRSIEELLED